MLRVEIEEIAYGLLNEYGPNCSLADWCRDLDEDRGKLRGSTDLNAAEDLATRVFATLVEVQTELVRATILRQEEDIKIAIEVLTAAVIDWDYNDATNNQGDSD